MGEQRDPARLLRLEIGIVGQNGHRVKVRATLA